MARPNKKNLETELQAVNAPTQILDPVEEWNPEFTDAPISEVSESEEIASLRLQLEQAQSERDYWQSQAPEQPEVDEEAELFYDGIKSPEYRLKTVYVPYNAQGISKNIAYDPDGGESYHYTMVKMAHCPPGETHHRMEEYRVRLDSRVVVPAFVAEALGNRADTQDYYPGVE